MPGARNEEEGALGLGERELTAATADADEHSPVVSAQAASSPTPRGLDSG